MLTDIFSRRGIIFIAEIGLNHNGDFNLAEEMIVKASKSGADAVKFQTFLPGKMNSPYTASLLESGEEKNPDFTIADFFSRFTFTEDQWERLKSLSEKCGVEFFSAPFDPESVELLERLGVRLYKIASSEVTNIPLIRKIGRTGKPVLLSTGMTREDEISAALGELKKSGNSETVLLHCVSLYPAKSEEANLKRITVLRDRFSLPVGLSDHTGDYHAAVISAALGATVIEKHFMLDRHHDCPDKDVSLTADDFKEMTLRVDETQAMLGQGTIGFSGRESDTARAARKSLFASRDIEEGELIDTESISVMRPGTGLSPGMIDTIAGRKANRKINKDSILKMDYFD